MPNVLNLVQGAVDQPRPQILLGQVSTLRPAPTHFTDPLYVVEPHRPDFYRAVSNWPACHGSTLPQQGASVMLAFDVNRNLRVLWWDSATTLFSATAINGTTVPLTGSAWTAPTLGNSWANQGGAFETAGYLKDPLGFVHLKGVVTGGATNTVAFTLPAGCRPGATTMHACGAGGGTSAQATAQIAATGTVSIQWTVSGSFIGLDIPSFLAEN